jgi:peptidyl-prolyl cis-trans isomerase D
MIRFLQTEGPVKKVILSGILLVICGAMVVTFIPGGLTDFLTGQPGRGIVAKVSGTDITSDEIRQSARQIAQRQAQQYGQMAAQLIPMLMPQATQMAANQLIMRQAMLAEADKMGLRVTPAEIREDLQHGRYAATFFPGGKFIGEQQYEDMLSGGGMTPATFEDSVGKDILIGKLEAFIGGGASVSDAEIRARFVKENTKVKFEYAVLKEDDLRKGLHPTDTELKAYYDSHQKEYANSIPEKRKVKYATVDLSHVEAGLQVSQADLESYYNQHRDQYRTTEQVKASHIWIKMPFPGADGKVDDKQVDAAQHRADDLLQQIKNGAKFEDIAKKYSEDPSSANVGGSLGWISRGQTSPEFEKVAFSMPKGQISGVVKSSDGFHIIRVDDKQEAHMKSLDEVKAQIEPIIKQQKAQQAAQKMAETLVGQARTQGIDAAAAASKTPVITSDFFGRNDILPGLGQAPQFMDGVFSATEKSPPDMAATSQGFVVYQLLAVKPAATPTFEEVRARVETEFKNEQASILLSKKTAELSDRAKAAHDLKKAAKELGAVVKTSDFVLPDGQVPDVGSMTGQASVAFNMKPGDISGPIMGDQNGVVIALLEKQDPSEADFAAKRDDIRDALLRTKKEELFGLFATNLREQMEKSGKIKVNQDEMKELTRNTSEEGAM